MDQQPPRPVVLCVLDGWGYREDPADNAVALANTPVFDRLWSSCPHAFLQASGEAVGLPAGQIGNSEVGHLNLGAGRVVMQELPRIDHAIAAGELETNPALGYLIGNLQANGGTCHLLGLISKGGVHSHQDHIAALARTISGKGVPVAIHAFLDGRDVPPRSGEAFLTAFLKDIADLPNVRLATVGGRYYAMDRDRRWDRVKKAYDAVALGTGERAADPIAYVRASYHGDVTDEFVIPAVLDGYAGMRDGDAVVTGNFRADRVREILYALLDPEFDGFQRERVVRFAGAVGMSTYSDDLLHFMAVIFPPQDLTRVLGEVVSEAGLTQLRAAETEKYPHVTFFLNGGEERRYPGEDRIMEPSPKVATYDLQPEMSAPALADKLVQAVDSGKYDLIVVNFANADMVGHTGILEAAIRAVETVDACLGRLEQAVLRQEGALFVTADHGNAELMRDPETGGPHTAHTLNLVPAILVNGPDGVTLQDGRLADVAPTLLHLLGVTQPAEMTGRTLAVASARPSMAAE